MERRELLKGVVGLALGGLVVPGCKSVDKKGDYEPSGSEEHKIASGLQVHDPSEGVVKLFKECGHYTKSKALEAQKLVALALKEPLRHNIFAECSLDMTKYRTYSQEVKTINTYADIPLKHFRDARWDIIAKAFDALQISFIKKVKLEENMNKQKCTEFDIFPDVHVFPLGDARFHIFAEFI